MGWGHLAQNLEYIDNQKLDLAVDVLIHRPLLTATLHKINIVKDTEKKLCVHHQNMPMVHYRRDYRLPWHVLRV